jgi:hypothetical protein
MASLLPGTVVAQSSLFSFMTSLVLPGETLWSVLNSECVISHPTYNAIFKPSFTPTYSSCYCYAVTLQYARILFLARLVRGEDPLGARGEMTH